MGRAKSDNPSGKKNEKVKGVISTKETPFYILDVLQDPDFKKHFEFRVEVAKEKSERHFHTWVGWYKCYKNDTDMFLTDIIDETKRMLGLQKASCIMCDMSSVLRNIVMPAVSDYICEKTGQPKPFEYIRNISTKLNYNFDCYYANPNRKNR